MKKSIFSAILCLASTFFIACAPMGGGGNRALSHTYQDSRGVTFISLFEMGTEVRGTSRTIGNGSSTKNLTVSHTDFEVLWGLLDEVKLSPYALKSDSDKFNAEENYVMMKGIMPSGVTIYVVPKSKAPVEVKSWVDAFRRKTQS